MDFARDEMVQYAIQVQQKSIELENQTSNIKDGLKELEDFIDFYPISSPENINKAKELERKKCLIREKREELVKIQSNIIKICESDRYGSGSSDDYASVPPVLKSILGSLYDLTDNTIDSNKATVHISEILDFSDSINAIYDELVESKIISESDKENQVRNEKIALLQQTLLNEMSGQINTEMNDDDEDNGQSEESENE